eukprot:1179276-Pyramimonas_sp.AAC.1
MSPRPRRRIPFDSSRADWEDFEILRTRRCAPRRRSIDSPIDACRLRHFEPTLYSRLEASKLL